MQLSTITAFTVAGILSLATAAPSNLNVLIEIPSTSISPFHPGQPTVHSESTKSAACNTQAECPRGDFCLFNRCMRFSIDGVDAREWGE
ncbi:hypothetical protein ONS95_001991 [Cadophora gregata]|uniref:uncharacterized protein n=1 Tax=Cadophora gregata TaxID=51156 RepID=UPI0026DC1ECE|nr:uncharacterized protein ONS95_001991 [Cadophora gregata]KAK0111647.1 hypothetical protein ONS95_001991 [Cadophora gregata]